MDKEELDRLIEKYLANTITPEERERLNSWYGSFDDEQVEIPVSEETTQEKVFSNLYKKVERRIHTRTAIQQMASRRFMKVAATLSLLAVISVLLIFHASNLYEWLYPIRYTEQQTPPGHTMRIKLFDGTIVTLNGNSSLRYPEVFNRKTRDVYLEGEAFFEVAKNQEKPFKIHTGDVVTTVLGTSFNIKAPRKWHELRVTVVTGKVMVSVADSVNSGERSGEQVLGILSPQDQLTYNTVTGTTAIVNHVDQRSIALWREGVLDFRSVTIQELVQQLEDWFGVTIQLVDSNMGQCRFTGSFKRLSLTRVLNLLATSNGFTYEQKDKTVIIKGGVSCNGKGK